MAENTHTIFVKRLFTLFLQCRTVFLFGHERKKFVSLERKARFQLQSKALSRTIEVEYELLKG